MIDVATLSVIRRWALREQLSIREIVRRTGLSRNTIRKYLREGEAAPSYAKRISPSKLDAFAEKLSGWLKSEASKSRKQRRTLKQMHADLAALGYQGSYNRVAAFARAWHAQRHAIQQTTGRGTFVPLAFGPGEAFQFDWSEDWAVIAGERTKLQVAHFKLSHSRAFIVRAYLLQTHEMLFDAHNRAFEVLGGVPRRGIYDNMKTAVDKVPRGKGGQGGKGRIVNARFAVMCAHYLFDADFCNVASGWEKGVVEKNVQDSRRRIWLEAQQQKFGSFADLNVWLGARCRSLWEEVRHPEYKAFSVAEMLEQERAELMPMPTAFDGYVERSAKVSSTCLVAVARNRYSVPCELAGQRVSTRLYPGRVEIASDEMIVARHERLPNRGHICYDWQHYIALIQRKSGALRNGAPFADMPTPLQRLRQGLMRHEGGEKTMAQVLNCVSSHGLEAVLVAAELVIESGALSTEHVLNVLARLDAPEPPPNIESTLDLKEAPLANTGRYDSLRGDAMEGVSHA